MVLTDMAAGSEAEHIHNKYFKTSTSKTFSQKLTRLVTRWAAVVFQPLT
jgi:hypothetical protein